MQTQLTFNGCHFQLALGLKSKLSVSELKCANVELKMFKISNGVKTEVLKSSYGFPPGKDSTKNSSDLNISFFFYFLFHCKIPFTISSPI